MNGSRDIPPGESDASAPGPTSSTASGPAAPEAPGQRAVEEGVSGSLTTLVLLLLGFTATSGQIFLLREFISTFHGNELVIGVYLSVWLLATAAGSGPAYAFLARRTGRGARTPGSLHSAGPETSLLLRFAVVEALAAGGLLFAVVGLMAPPAQLRPSPGEVVGLVSALACSAVFLFPFCVFQGLLFPLGAALVRSRGRRAGPNPAGGEEGAPERAARNVITGRAASVSRVYFLEAAGAAAGGLLLSLLLVRLLGSFRIASALASLNLFAAAAVAYSASRAAGAVSTGPAASLEPGVEAPARPLARPRLSRWLSWVLACLCGVSLVVCVLDPVTGRTASLKWGGLTVREVRQSRYGNLAVLSVDSQYSVYQDGLLVATTDDVQSSEEIGHIPMLEHPRPERVLLIGGGIGGVVREMLKHPSLVRLDYVELDPDLIALARDVLPREKVADLSDPRVRVLYQDGRRFLQTTAERYDLVTMQVPPPYTAQFNRFYTHEFFGLVRRHLRPGGVFAFALPEVKEYVSRELASFLAALVRTAAGEFRTVVLVPASRSLLVCSPDQNDYVVASPDSLVDRLAARGVVTLFVRDYFLSATLSPDRLRYAEERVRAQDGRVNTDLRPIGFYYDLVLWSAEYERVAAVGLRWVFAHAWVVWAAAGALAAALLLPAVGSRSRARGALLPSALAVSGFAAMVLELEIVLCFQLLYGNLYDRIGILFTAYMVGLAAGAWTERRWKSGQEDAAGGGTLSLALTRPAVLQFLTAGFAACFLVLVHFAPRSGVPAARALLEWLFPLLSGVAGGLGGAFFSSAGRAYFDRSGGRRQRVQTAGAGYPDVGLGATYAWDLAGSWAGAVLTSSILFPVVGVLVATSVVGGLLVASGCGLVLAARRAQPHTPAIGPPQ